MAAYNLAFRHGLPRPVRKMCSRCRHIKYVRGGERAYQREYKRRIRKSKAA